MNIPTIPADKAQHYFYGSLAGLAGVAAAAGLHLLLRVPLSLMPVFALLAAVGAGVWKEWRDELANQEAEAAGQPAPHEVSLADVRWTAAGAGPVILACAVLLMVRHG